MKTVSRTSLPALVIGVAALSMASLASAATLSSGSAVFTLDQAAFAANSNITTLDAWFDNTATRTQTLTDPAPGDGFTLPNIGAAVNVGVLADPDGPGGRTLQTSNLDVDLNNILGTWSAAADFGPFVGSGTSEQIGLEGMQRWLGNYTGVLLFGDFAIRNAPGRAGVVRSGNTLSGLVITSNIDFANAAFLDIANAIISGSGSTLSITGDLVISDGFQALDGSAILGADVGNFSLNATVVPLPAALPLLGSGLASLALAGWRRKKIAA